MVAKNPTIQAGIRKDAALAQRMIAKGSEALAFAQKTCGHPAVSKTADGGGTWRVITVRCNDCGQVWEEK